MIIMIIVISLLWYCQIFLDTLCIEPIYWIESFPRETLNTHRATAGVYLSVSATSHQPATVITDIYINKSSLPVTAASMIHIKNIYFQESPSEVDNNDLQVMTNIGWIYLKYISKNCKMFIVYTAIQ